MATLFLVLIHEQDRQVIRAGLQNDTAFSFVLNGEITFNGPDPIRLAGSIAPHAMGDFGEIPFDQINDYPHFELELERYSTRGQEEEVRKKIKPKPRHFIKLVQLDDWDNKPGRKYPVWNEEKFSESENKISSKRKKEASSAGPANPAGLEYRVIRDLSDLAALSREIDLHAEVLFEDPASVTPELIYKRQMEVFRNYMRKVKGSSIKRVFIIHGIGSGRLKSSIARALDFDPDVAEYINEYHPKYGFGATEVIFR